MHVQCGSLSRSVLNSVAWGIPILAVVILLVTAWKIVQSDPPLKSGSPVKHVLAVIVPFRERFTNLLTFLPHMHHYLKRKRIPHTFYIVNQADDLRFNRGALLNVGVKESALMESRYFESTASSWTIPLPRCSMLALHDVDLLPVADDLKYEHFGRHPYHLIPYWMHPRYNNYQRYIGGALIISRDSFLRVNGFSTRFWGWGYEDDEFGIRMREADLVIQSIRKPAVVVPKFQHIHSEAQKREISGLPPSVSRKRDHSSGFNTTAYTVLSRVKVEIGNVSAWIVNVNLHCDLLVTPYCQRNRF